MKHNILAALTLGLCLALGGLTSCAEKELEAEVSASATGSLKVKLSMPVTKSTGDYDALKYSTLRIYQVEKGSDNNETLNLVRRYKPATSMPENLYLAADEYKIVVEAGKGAEATFTDKTYYGEERFVLEANKNKTVTVECGLSNIIVKVVFDETVRTAFDQGFSTWVSAVDEFSLSDAEGGTVPSLQFTSDNTGYFILPEGVSNLCWSFQGSSSDEAINAKGSGSGRIANPEAGKQYTMTYKYSPDAPGILALSMDLMVQEYESLYEDLFLFSPQPVLTFTGLEADVTNLYASQEVSVAVSTVNPLSDISLKVGEDTYAVMTAGTPGADNQNNGLSLSVTDQTNAVLTMTTDFFAKLQGGVYSFEFSATDSNGGETSVDRSVAVAGASGMTYSDLWFGTAALQAVAPSTASDVKILYKLQGEQDWTEVAASATGEDYQYSASVSGITADKVYDIKLSVDGSETGNVYTAATITGTQLPNAGFEDWHQSGNPWYPYAQGGTEFWGTGNPGSTALGADGNITTSSTDIRPESTGKLSARLETKKVAGKLAAGNIFVGSFGRTIISLTSQGGTVNMGREFEFNAKPKALRVWYKYTPAGTDKGRIFLCMVNMTGEDRTHVVNTTEINKTAFSPDDEFLYEDSTNEATLQGHVVAYADLMLETTVSDWTCVEIPITYREKYASEKSNTLILAATTSYRGDYFEGETGSLMYVDDVEFVY